MATAERSTEFTPKQVAHFETFGYVVLRGLFSPEEMTEVSQAYDEVMEEDRGGKPFTGPSDGKCWGSAACGRG